MHERPLPPSLPQDAYDARALTYRALFADRTTSVALWAWAHGLLILELAGRYESEIDVEQLWAILIDRIVASDG
jgi:hypothetical protein